MVAVVFIVAFVPSLSQPFTTNQSEVTTADRVADQLGEGMLGSPSEPYILDETCTVEFFDQLQGGGAAPSDCNYDTGVTTLTNVTNVPETTGMNVTIEKTGGGIATVSGVDLRAGDDPAGVSNVNVAQRTVFVDGEPHKLFVRVW